MQFKVYFRHWIEFSGTSLPSMGQVLGLSLIIGETKENSNKNVLQTFNTKNAFHLSSKYSATASHSLRDWSIREIIKTNDFMQKYMVQRTILAVLTVWIAYFKLSRSIVLNKEAKVQNQATECLAHCPV